jgi:molybdate-binding protein
VEPTAAGLLEHDGVFQNGSSRTTSRFMPDRTLIVASCDPAAGLLAAEVSRLASCRVIVLPRSSQHALALLAKGLVHVAGLHLSTDDAPEGNRAAVRSKISSGCSLLRVARWQEGVALSTKSRLRSVRAVVRSGLRWIAREPGSGARQCLDELLDDGRTLRRMARDHRGVAEAVRCDWADAGVCLRLVCEEAGLQFLSVREEVYELCFRAACEDDHRIRALKDAIRSASYRRLLGELPGYRPEECGELESVN